MRPNRIIGIMAKAPLPNQAKTRLIPLLGAERAALLYRQMLLDTIELVDEALQGAGDVGIICPTDDHRAILQDMVPAHVQVIAHGCPDLMSGLDCGLATFLERGYREVILFNGDSPTLPPDYLRSAFALLDRNAVVLGPTFDGGYYLIAARANHPTLFSWERFDSAAVCRHTQERAEAYGARVALLPRWYDIDTPDDYAHLVAEMEAGATGAPRTRRFIRGGLLDG